MVWIEVVDLSKLPVHLRRREVGMISSFADAVPLAAPTSLIFRQAWRGAVWPKMKDFSYGVQRNVRPLYSQITRQNKIRFALIIQVFRFWFHATTLLQAKMSWRSFRMELNARLCFFNGV
jgi:hypothetical protein